MYRGVFITFEGGEGAGKSTLIDEMARQLASEGHQVVKTREPGGTRVGEQIRSMLLDHHTGSPLTSHAELCLYLAARAQHIDEIIDPALRSGKIVLCDRFNDSTIAYQGIARGLGADKVKQFCEFVCHGVLPDLTLYLDVDPAVGLSRARRDQPQIAGARGYDRIESEGIAFHQKVRDAFRAIHARDSKRFIMLDASRLPDAIATEAIKIIHSKIK